MVRPLPGTLRYEVQTDDGLRSSARYALILRVRLAAEGGRHPRLKPGQTAWVRAPRHDGDELNIVGLGPTPPTLERPASEA